MPTVRQVAQVVTVLVHDREPLDPLVGRPGLRDVDDAGMEIAALPGQPLVDLVRHGVGDGAPRLTCAAELQPHQTLLGEHVPKAELDHETARIAGHHAAGHQRLGVDDAPIRKARPDRHRDRLRDEGSRLDRLEQAGALQVVGDDVGDISPHLRVRPGLVGAVVDRDGERLHVAARDVHPELGPGRGGGRQDCQRDDDGGREGQGATRRTGNKSTQCRNSSHLGTVVSSGSIVRGRESRLTPAD